jgi:hypothetical protein
MVNQQENEAIKFVVNWAESQGINVYNFHKKGVGYDLEFKYPDGKVEKVEVKGTKAVYRVPDLSVREFKDKKLKADYLLVVGNVLGEEKILFRIPRDAIPKESLVLKKTYYVRQFQNKKNMVKFIVLIPKKR